MSGAYMHARVRVHPIVPVAPGYLKPKDRRGETVVVLDPDVREEMRAEAKRLGWSVSRVVREAWMRAQGRVGA